MALVVGNKTIQSIIPQYDGAGVLNGILVRVNRSVVDNATVPATFRYSLATSLEVEIWGQLTAAQRGTATTFFNRMTALIGSLAEFEE